MLIRLLACGALAAARIFELRISRQNIATSGPGVEQRWTRRTYPLILGLHTLVIGGTALRGRSRCCRPWLAALVVAQPVRMRVLALLGRRWNARAVVPDDLAVETRWPYSWVRHPNYAVIFVELVALPAAFGLPRLAGFALAANAALLAPRIREEEAALMRFPDYAREFRGKRRLVPYLF